MTDLEKLIIQLKNLQKSKAKSVTLDINYLLNVLNAVPTTVQVRHVTPVEIYRKVDVDGGSFSDD